MTDLATVLPDLDTSPFSHLLPGLERALVTTTDLLTLDAATLAKRAQLPTPELRKLIDAIVPALHADVVGQGDTGGDNDARHGTAIGTDASLPFISTLDHALDKALGGGVPAGYLTEITGESGAGKTQFLLTLLLAAQLPPPLGLGRPAIYISTEAVLSTTRLSQLLATHPALAHLPSAVKPSLSRILSIQTPDLEAQEHILRYQLPVAITKHNAGLVILDSVAANFRAEATEKRPEALAARSAHLASLGTLLRSIANKGVAVVVANQVADRFDRPPTPTPPQSRTPSSNSQTTRTPPPLPSHILSPDALALDHQQRWFTGWGDNANATRLKTPALGLVWANQLACRVALIKDPVFGHEVKGEEGIDGNEGFISRWRRWARVVFSPWVAPTAGKGVEFEIVKGGVRALVGQS